MSAEEGRDTERGRCRLHGENRIGPLPVKKSGESGPWSAPAGCFAAKVGVKDFIGRQSLYE
jgi:hypothetical protein